MYCAFTQKNKVVSFASDLLCHRSFRQSHQGISSPSRNKIHLNLWEASKKETPQLQNNYFSSRTMSSGEDSSPTMPEESADILESEQYNAHADELYHGEEESRPIQAPEKEERMHFHSYQHSSDAQQFEIALSRNDGNLRMIFYRSSIFVTLFVGIVTVMGIIKTDSNDQFLGNYNIESRPHSQEDSTSESAFPPNFIWGAATSAFQIEGGSNEGGRGPSIWDTWCVQSDENCNGDTGDVSDDHYHHWKDDIKMMKNMGLKAYRFSISWSRILPNGTADFNSENDNMAFEGINYQGIRFYNKIIDNLIEAGLEPFVTLYHWDLPQALQDRYGGWINHSIIQDFADYARICFHYFGDRVKYWITINEGWTVAIHGYEEASNAPGVLGEDIGGTGKPYLIGHHLLLSHAKAVKVFREEGYDQRFGNDGERSLIGLSNSGDYRFPLDVNSEDDREAATRAMEFQLGWMVRWRGIIFCLFITTMFVTHTYMLFKNTAISYIK